MQNKAVRYIHSISNGGIDGGVDQNIPIYDLQMQEGPQIKARLLMKELQTDEEKGYKPKIVHGFAFKHI